MNYDQTNYSETALFCSIFFVMVSIGSLMFIIPYLPKLYTLEKAVKQLLK